LPSTPQDSVRRPGLPGYGDGFFPRKLIQTFPNAHGYIMDMLERKFKSLDLEGLLTCRVFGDPTEGVDTFVILPGGPGIHSAYLDEFAAGLSREAGMKVILFDLPGHQVGGLANRKPSKWPDFRESCDWLDTGIRSVAEAGKTMVLGHSFGGLLALELMSRDKAFFNNVFLVSTPVADEVSDRYEAAKKKLGLGSVEINTHEDFKTYWKQILPLYFNRTPNAGEFDLLTKETFWVQGIEMWKGVIWPMERKSTGMGDASVMLVQGDVDLRVPEGNAKRLKKIFPKAQFVEMPGVGHFPMLEAPDVFLRTIRKVIEASDILR